MLRTPLRQMMPMSSPATAAASPAATSEPVPIQAPEKGIFGQYFRWRPVPWWICFPLGIFMLTKFQLVYNDSPCAVLGIQSPVTSADVKRAFRTLSMCTHPDRLRGRLKREPTKAESRRGEIIFNRASAAKDELTRVLRASGKREVQCYQGELELAVFLFFSQVGKLLSELGVSDYFSMAFDLFWSLAMFEAGFFNTLLALLWLGFVFRLVKQFFTYLWRMGILRGTAAVVSTVVIGPIPTIVNFCCLPILRIMVWLKATFSESRPSQSQDSPDTVTDTPEPPTTDLPSTAALAAARAANKELPAGSRHIRQRKKKETEEEQETRNKALLTGEAQATAGGSTQAFNLTLNPMPEGMFECLTWTHKEPVKARLAAATACQFDLLLILTKPVIPLFMLIASGQVWNGLISSMIIGHALRKWIPQMSYEAHHLLCSFFGVVHTLLGVSASQVEDYANREGKKVLHLAWSWSFKDVLCVMNMCQLGATMTAMSGLGNEPSYAVSFAAGIALRIAIAQDTFRSFGFMSIMTAKAEESLKDLGVAMDAAEEVVAYSGGGIGDCGGGPFRMLFGDGPGSEWAALILKVWLMLLPALSAAQWLQRTMQAGKMLGRRNKTTRFVQRLVLALLGFVQVGLIANTELNASNGALGNFWMAMLFGCIGESLLSTYDIRGPVRQIVFLLLFLFI